MEHQSRIANILIRRDSGDGSRLSLTTTGWSVIWFVVLLLFLPSLSFPLGPDNGLFFVAGEKIVHQGAIHYRDIVDVKPPMIYYVNALAITLFGDSPISIRLLDLFCQLLTTFFLVRLIRRVSGSGVWAGVAMLLFPLLYLSLNYANTAQVESFIGLCTLPAIGLFLFRRSGTGFLGIGLLCGILTIFKFTFGITLAGFLIGDLLLFQDNWKDRLQRYAMMGAGYGIIIGLFFLYLFGFDAWNGFLEMQQFLGGYTGIQFASKGDMIREGLTQLPRLMSDEYSLTLLFGTIVAMGWAFVPGRGGDKSGKGLTGNRTAELLRISTFLFLLLLLTIGIEGKWLHYHLSRLFALGALLGSFGLVRIGRALFARPIDRFRWIGFGLALLLLFGFSPLTRYLFHIRPALLYVTKGPEAFDAFYAHVRNADDWTMEDVKEIGSYLSSRLEPQDKLYISSGVAGLLYRASGYVPEVPIFHSGFLIAPFSPPAWMDSTISYLTTVKPRFIVLHRSDRMAIITGTNETSEELFHRIPETAHLLDEEYEVVMERPGFQVYERK